MKASKIVKAGGNLKDYSPWLATFQTRSETYELEIPGTFVVCLYFTRLQLDAGMLSCSLENELRMS
jgi:hypothetical protein